MDTVVGLFDQLESAQRSLEALRSAGFLDEDIHFVTQEHGVRHLVEIHEENKDILSNPEPDLDNIIAHTAENMLGSLAHLVLPDEDAKNYTDGIRRGGVLIIVHLRDGRFRLAQQIMANEGAVDVQFIYHAFRNTPWIPFGLLQDSSHKIPLLADRTV